jgi:hypothetical protein
MKTNQRINISLEYQIIQEPHKIFCNSDYAKIRVWVPDYPARTIFIVSRTSFLHKWFIQRQHLMSCQVDNQEYPDKNN